MTDRWATFDCYGTLIDWETGIGATLSALWPDADLERLLEQYHRIEPEVEQDDSLPYRRVLTDSLRRLAADEGLTLPAEEVGALAASLPSWPVFEEVPGALTRLREAGWRLAILSNTDPDLLAKSIETIGVPFDMAVTAREAGSYKPKHGHWKHFFDISGADSDQHVHVAASLFHDISPAGEMGLHCVWINRLQEVTNLPRDAELPDLSELPEVLERLVPRG